MSNAIRVKVDPRVATREFYELVSRCYREDPDKKDLKALRKEIDEKPELWRNVFDLAAAMQDNIIKSFNLPKAAIIGVERNLVYMMRGLGYAESPTLERILIDHVLNCWLRLQAAEWGYSAILEDSHTMSEGDYRAKILNASQRRYLRACETLGRIRKLTHNTPTLQVNIATESGQQVNIAGDIVKT